MFLALSGTPERLSSPRVALQNCAESIALDAYVLEMPLDIQTGSLGAKKFNSEIHSLQFRGRPKTSRRNLRADRFLEPK